MSFRSKFKALFRKQKLDADMAEEMQAHLERRTQANIAAGLPPDEARYAAQRSFGGVDQLKEVAREERGFPRMENFLRELRHAARNLWKAPGFAVVAVLTLALGVGINTSMFSVVNRLLLRPLAYPEANRLVRVFGTSKQADNLLFTAPYLAELHAPSPAIASQGAYLAWSGTLTEPNRPAEFLMTLRVSAELLPTLGVQPELGRLFTAEEDRPGSNVVILPHSTWLRLFSGDRDVIGRTVRIDATAMTVVGVMPEQFDAPLIFGPVGLIRPLGITPLEQANTTQRGFNLIARLAPGASAAQAEAGLRAIAARLAEAYPNENKQTSVRVVALHASGTNDTARSLTLFVLGLSGFVLLIACANLANLQLVRATIRSRDNAIRLALGASRSALIRALALESLLLAAMGGAAGILTAVWCNAWISHRAVLFGDVRLDLPLDVRVLAFAVGTSLLTGLLFGTAPGWLVSRTRVNDTLKQQARGSSAGRASGRLRHALVVGELALALVLLAGSGFFLTGLQRFASRDPGWNTNDLAFGSVPLPDSRYAGPGKSHRFYRDLRDRLAVTPGVEGVAIGWSLPMFTFLSTRGIAVEGHPPAADGRFPLAFANAVLPGYFETLQIPFVAGRTFDDFDDRPEAPARVIINETMARALWPGESALGKRIGGTDPARPGWMEIVGVVRDVGFATNLGTPLTRFQMFRPFAQEPWGYAGVAVRTKAPAMTMVEPLRRAVDAIDPEVAVDAPTTVREAMEQSTVNFGLLIRLLAGFALLGLLLAALGIYGVTAYAVAQRTQEIGVRIALGAAMRDVMWMILGSGLRLALVGAVIGVAGAVALGRVLASVAPELGMPQPMITVLAASALIAVSLGASFLSARRATKVDPIIALRAE